MIEPRLLLSNLDLSDAEVDVYLAMVNGALSARDIVKVTGRSRPTVYYSLTALERRGLLSKTGLEDDQRFRLEPFSRLRTMVQERQAELLRTQRQVDEFIKQNQRKKRGDSKPQVSFYEGVAGVRSVIMESIYCHGRHIDSLVPTENFFWQLGPDFVEHYVEMRQDIGVTTRNLWGTTINPDSIKKFYTKSQIRMLPKGLGERFRSTIFMYDDSVLYISSLASGYALLVKSKEHRELMQMFYDVLWEASKPLAIQTS